jgi:hypothetical protein
MAKSSFNLREFTAKIQTVGLARPNRFEVEIIIPQSIKITDKRKISLFCEISSLPGMSIVTKPLKIYGPAYQRPISAEYNGEAIGMTFYVDQSMEVKAFFDAWMNTIVNSNSFTVEYAENYAVPITIRQLDEQDNIQYTVELVDAFPRAITMLELNMASINQVHKLNVIFTYRKWISTHNTIKTHEMSVIPVMGTQSIANQTFSSSTPD